jgi:hypothetical protein
MTKCSCLLYPAGPPVIYTNDDVHCEWCGWPLKDNDPRRQMKIIYTGPTIAPVTVTSIHSDQPMTKQYSRWKRIKMIKFLLILFTYLRTRL